MISKVRIKPARAYALYPFVSVPRTPDQRLTEIGKAKATPTSRAHHGILILH
jgi:hypothetical protein